MTGEVGCGKTTLCRHFINEIDDEKYESALILNPRITETQLLKTILTELGEEGSSRSRSGLVKQVKDILLDKIQQGKDILLIIDEAQNLTFELLEQLRLLSNLETDKQKLLQIILMGQPEFKRILSENRLRQLRQRILVHTELRPLNRYQVEQYIHHRIAMAGGQGIPFFTSWAVRWIHWKSRGIPRIINNICDKSLLSAYIRSSEVVKVTYSKITRLNIVQRSSNLRRIMDEVEYDSPIGLLQLEADEQGLTAVRFPKPKATRSSIAQPSQNKNRHLKSAVKELESYFANGSPPLRTTLSPQGTNFQKSVWIELSKISSGSTTTYGEIADRIGNPKASRAVGLANNRNPLPIFLPCHRVIGKSGKLVGYAGEIWRKEWLLKHEGALL